MGPLKNITLLNHLTWFMEKYVLLQQQKTNDAFRITDIFKNNLGICTLRVQVIGKAIWFDISPEKIVQNDDLLERFSKKDIRTITYYATREKTQPAYKLLVQDFCNELNRVIFRFTKRGEEAVIEKNAIEASGDIEFIKSLSAEDAHVIGYTAASEAMLSEKEQMAEIKKSKHPL